MGAFYRIDPGHGDLTSFVVFISPLIVPFDGTAPCGGTFVLREVPHALFIKASAKHDPNSNIKSIHTQSTPQVS